MLEFFFFFFNQRHLIDGWFGIAWDTCGDHATRGYHIDWAGELVYPWRPEYLNGRVRVNGGRFFLLFFSFGGSHSSFRTEHMGDRVIDW